jgi:site-specific DNA recombinase
VRVSTGEQGLGSQAQRETLQRWCAVNGATLLAVFADRGVGGATRIDKRPGLLAALAALRERQATMLLVAALVERMVEQHGGVVRTADGTGNGNAPEAILLRRIVDAFAEYERLMICARTKRRPLLARRERLPQGW